MEFASFDLVASLQALPETDPIEVDGIQFGAVTCEQDAECEDIAVTAVQTVCGVITCVD